MTARAVRRRRSDSTVGLVVREGKPRRISDAVSAEGGIAVPEKE